MPALFELDDTPANLPIGGGHQRVEAAGGGAAGGFQQGNKVTVNAAVVGGVWNDVGHNRL